MAEGEESFFANGGLGGPLFLLGRRAAEGEREAAADLRGVRFDCFRPEAFGEVAGLFEHEGVMAEGECLKGRGGGEALGGEVGRVGAVKGGEEFVRGGADNKAVDASSPEFRSVGCDVFVDRRVGLNVLEVPEAGAAGF